MEGNYFLSFDYWTHNRSKFWSGIVSIDFSDTSLQQVCVDRIDSLNHEEHKDTWVVKITSFNNIK